MIEIESIVDGIKSNRVRITDHADEEASNDDLTYNVIVDSIPTGEIIEQYPDDKPYPSCLILSKCPKDEPMHSVWAYNHLTKASV